MARRSPARLVIALSVAAALAIFLLYNSIAGAGTVSIQPGELAAHRGETVQLAGIVLAPVRGDARAGGLRFRMRDIKGTASVPVVYEGSVPDPFRVGREVYLRGSLRKGVFVAERNSLVTKCPSKYSAEKD